MIALAFVSVPNLFWHGMQALTTTIQICRTTSESMKVTIMLAFRIIKACLQLHKYRHLIEWSVMYWMYSGEIPNNGIDDDNNGFVDDYYG